MHRFALVLSILALAVAVQAGTAAALGFNVNVTYDAFDAFPGDLKCDDGTGNCTLRAAVQESNATAAADDISVPGGVYQLTLVGPGAAGDLDIYTQMRITGQGPRRTIVDGIGADRVFDVRSTTAIIGGLMIRGGREFDGAGIRTVNSTLTLHWSDLWVDNASYGGGIAAYESRLKLSGVTFVDDTSTDLGGAIYLYSASGGGSADLENVTIHGNASKRGGGIFANNAPLRLRNVTIADNNAALGGGIYHLGVSPLAYNTIVALNGGQDCANPITSAANNLDSDGTCGFFNPGDLPFTNPILDPLAYLSAPVFFPTPNWVRPLNPASPALGAGDPTTCTTVDERNFPRPLPASCDIGAFELP
jgi:hypothetical protein